ncbi:hypothetical protein HON03_05260 [archaeon]|jgi:hypothetical protein|nr:hypothetical protein [archaeon]MBT5287997.1 hypothetical protein [archaeon]
MKAQYKIEELNGLGERPTELTKLVYEETPNSELFDLMTYGLRNGVDIKFHQVEDVQKLDDIYDPKAPSLEAQVKAFETYLR